MLIARVVRTGPHRPFPVCERGGARRLADRIDARPDRARARDPQRADRQRNRRRLPVRLQVRPIPAKRLEPQPRDTAQPVQTQLRLAPVGVQHHHPEIRGPPGPEIPGPEIRSPEIRGPEIRVLSRRGQQQQPVAADRPAPVGQGPRDPCPSPIARRVDRPRIDHHEIIARSVAFDDI